MNRKPLIGIVGRVEFPGSTGKLVVNESVRRVVIKHGGNPMCLLLPQDINYTEVKSSEQPELTEEEKEMIRQEVDICDGIFFPGGNKINKADKYFLDYIIETNKPLLGICLGMQTIGSYGENLLTNEENATGPVHSREQDECYHYVTIDKSSKLFKIVGKDRLYVNSRHHYHLIPNENYKVVAVSDDNIVEGIEFENKDFVIGVQWHPEDLDDEESKKIFDAFIDACKAKM